MKRTKNKESDDFKDRLRQHFKRERKNYKETGMFLHDAAVFNHAVRLSQDKHPTLQVLFDSMDISGYKLDEKYTNLEILIANLFEHRKPIKIPRHNKYWTGRYCAATYSTIELIDKLEKMNLITQKKGYYDPIKHIARYTRIYRTDELLNLFQLLPHHITYKPVEVVELRDKNGELKEYTETATSEKYRRKLTTINQTNEEYDIKYHRYKIRPYLTAIFNNNFSLGGRLYTKGYKHYQGLNKEDRHILTFNGKPTVELDYKALHPALLYAQEGIQLDFDPYTVVDPRPELRGFLKLTLLAMLNAPDRNMAQRPANVEIVNNYKWFESFGITKSAPIIDKFIEAHQPIAKYFCTGAGMKLMNADSKIALDICYGFAKQGKPILAIHDSFIVLQEDAEELKIMMKKVYKKHSKGYEINVTKS